MANTIISKNGSGVPANGTLARGELAVDVTNFAIYSSSNGTDIIKVGSGTGEDMYAEASNNIKISNDPEVASSETGAATANKAFQIMHRGVVRVSYEIKKSDTARNHHIRVAHATGRHNGTFDSSNITNYTITPVSVSNVLNGLSNDTYYAYSHDITVVEAGYLIIQFTQIGSQASSTGRIRNARISYDTTSTEPAELGIALVSVAI